MIDNSDSRLHLFIIKEMIGEIPTDGYYKEGTGRCGGIMPLEMVATG